MLFHHSVLSHHRLGQVKLGYVMLILMFFVPQMSMYVSYL